MMRKTILSALIAATALVPVAASAQDQPRWRGNRGQNAGDAPQQRPGGFDRQAFRAQRQAERAQQQQAAPQAQPQQQRPAFDREAWRAQRAAQQQAAPQQRPDREAWRAQREAQRAAQGAPAQAGVPNRGAWQHDRQNFVRERRDDRQDFRQERREDRRDLANGRVTPEQYRADRRDDRQDYRRDRRDDRQDYRGDRQRGDWNRGNQYNRGGDWNRGGNRWNRTWRSDRRYDWQDWRQRNRSAYRLPRYYAPRGYHYGYQRFSIGITLGQMLFSSNYWINDPWAYRLPPAYGPYRWVRYYNDALLVDVDTGEVVDVIYDIFW